VANGRRRGDCAGVAKGVCSGVGELESCEKVGEDGAVELGDDGRDRLAWRARDASSSSCDRERTIDCAWPYADSGGSFALGACATGCK
jgi:hypothetical protein